jgi:hypothetical protein
MDEHVLTDKLTVLQRDYPQFDMPKLRKAAFGYVNYLLQQHVWWDANAVLTGEGGKASMAYNAILEALAVLDMQKGFKNYGHTLTSLYSRGNSDNRTLSLSVNPDLIDTLPTDRADGGRLEELSSDGLGSSPSALLLARLKQAKESSAARTVRRRSPTQLQYSEQELDCLDTYAHTGNLKEAAELTGVDYQRARLVLTNIRRFIKRNLLVTPDI